MLCRISPIDHSLRELGEQPANGFASPMRGKSLTYRNAFSKNHSGLWPPGRRPELQGQVMTAKSKTCRASEWQSHCANRLAPY